MITLGMLIFGLIVLLTQLVLMVGMFIISGRNISGWVAYGTSWIVTFITIILIFGVDQIIKFGGLV